MIKADAIAIIIVITIKMKLPSHIENNTET